MNQVVDRHQNNSAAQHIINVCKVSHNILVDKTFKVKNIINLTNVQNFIYLVGNSEIKVYKSIATSCSIAFNL
jgi:hypothetical protein